MELILLWQLVRRWWLLIAIPTVIATLWSLPAIPNAISPPETYGASIRFSAAAPPDAENIAAAETDELPRSGTYEDTAYVPWLASEYVVVNLPQWVTSSTFADEVSTQLANQGIDISGDDVQAALNADSARSIMVIYFGWDDEAELEAIAEATITVLQTRNNEYFPQFASEPAVIVPLDSVEVNQTFPPITVRLSPFIRIVIGLFAGVGLMALAAYFDDRVYSKDDLQRLELDVLASIPQE